MFVGGVHHECDEERLREFFEKAHGEVESVKMIYDRMTSARKGYGFVKFREGGVADAVRAQLAPAAASEERDAESESVDDVIAAVRDLSPEESAVLQASATRVAEALWDGLVERLEGSLLANEAAASDAASAAR